MEILIIIVVTVIIALVIAGVASSSGKQKTVSSVRVKDRIAQLHDFDPTHVHETPNGLKGIALDARRQQIGVFEIRKDQFDKRLYHFTDIVEVSTVEDGNADSTTSTSRSSQLVGAAVGGLLLGGTGVLLGGLSANKTGTSQEFATSLSLRIVVNDLVNPVTNISFYSGRIPKTSPQYQAVRNELSKWNGLLSILLRRAEELTDDEYKREKEIAKQIASNNSMEPEPSPVEDDIMSLVKAGKKIEAIKLYRSQTNVGLREAKDYIDSL